MDKTEQVAAAADAFNRHEDSAGRLLPGSSLESGMIPDGMCLALSDHPGSFDSRFFGLVPLADVVKVKPVFTIKE